MKDKLISSLFFLLYCTGMVCWLSEDRLTPKQLLEMSQLCTISDDILDNYHHHYNKTCQNFEGNYERYAHNSNYPSIEYYTIKDSLFIDFKKMNDRVGEIDLFISDLKMNAIHSLFYNIDDYYKQDYSKIKSEGSMHPSIIHQDSIIQLSEKIAQTMDVISSFQKKYLGEEKIKPDGMIENEVGIPFIEYHFGNSNALLSFISLNTTFSGILDKCDKIISELNKIIIGKTKRKILANYEVEISPEKEEWQVGEIFKAKIQVIKYIPLKFDFIEFLAGNYKSSSKSYVKLKAWYENGIYQLQLPLNYDENKLIIQYKIPDSILLKRYGKIESFRQSIHQESWRFNTKPNKTP